MYNEDYLIHDSAVWIINADDNYLMHHGIRGMKWGVRRFEDFKGRLTSAGKKRYGTKYDNRYKNKKSSSSSKKEKLKKAAKIAAGTAAIAGTAALATYGAKKIGKQVAFNNAYRNASDATRAIIDENKRQTKMRRSVANDINGVSSAMLRGTGKVIGASAKVVGKGIKAVAPNGKKAANKVANAGQTKIKNVAKNYVMKDVDPDDIRTWGPAISKVANISSKATQVVNIANKVRQVKDVAKLLMMFK